MVIDLRKGFGNFLTEYAAFKFPDESIKTKLFQDLVTDSNTEDIHIKVSFRNHDEIFALGLLKRYLDDVYEKSHHIYLSIYYMMYQQDDMRFAEDESFGLKFFCEYLNMLGFYSISVFHPHSPVTGALLNNCHTTDNTILIESFFRNRPEVRKNGYWVIPDSGAFKGQFKQQYKLKHSKSITANKSRDFTNGAITTVVPEIDLNGSDCFIIDDICLAGNTFIQLAEELKKRNAGKLYLLVSHGIFNKGVDHLFEHFEEIYTTDSICSVEHEKLKIAELE